jgi:uncharacterized RDD family membrane protein YckC
MASPVPGLPLPQYSTPSFGGYALQEEGLEGATFWPRAFARVIDFVVHYLVGFLTGILFRIMLTIASGGHVPLRILLSVSKTHVPLFVAGWLGIVVYEVLATTVHGSSLGKRIVGLVVVREDGSPCGFRSAVIRELGYMVDSIFFGLVGYMAMQKNRQEQRYGDQWAGTVVCHRSALAPENLRGPGRFVLALMLSLMADSAIMLTGLLIQLNG